MQRTTEDAREFEQVDTPKAVSGTGEWNRHPRPNQTRLVKVFCLAVDMLVDKQVEREGKKWTA